jgi:hypothetical protein
VSGVRGWTIKALEATAKPLYELLVRLSKQG